MVHEGMYKSLLEVVATADAFPHGPICDSIYTLHLPNDDQPHGYLIPETVARLPWTNDFVIQHEQPRKVTVIDSSAGKDTPGAVNLALKGIHQACIDHKIDYCADFPNGEAMLLPSARYDRPVYIDRYLTSVFGTTSQGAMLIAYTRAPLTDEIKLWIGQRPMNMATAPGKRDITVAGAIKARQTPWTAILAEAHEEASLTRAQMDKYAVSRGTWSAINVTNPTEFPRSAPGLMTPDVAYLYDMELPADIVPKPNDDEVEGFSLMGVDDVRAAILNGEFKIAPACTIIQFFIRHGIITPENEPGFAAIDIRLHRRMPFRTAIW